MLSGAMPGVIPTSKYVPDVQRPQPGRSLKIKMSLSTFLAAYMADPRLSKVDDEGYI